MPPDPERPQVWAILGNKAGDNAQVMAVARATGFPVEEKRLPSRELQPSLLPTLVRTRRSRTRRVAPPWMTPPWPDLVVAVGRKSVPLVREIKRRSGGRTALVHLGRPRAPLRWFDLIVTTPQYGLPERSNVLHLGLPFQAPDPRALDQARKLFRAQFPADRPLIALLVGGNTSAHRFDGATIDLLAQQVRRFVQQRQASLAVSCGRRLPDPARHRLQAALQDEAVLFHGFGDPAPNPYLGLLACAAEFIVTSDSVSTLADAVSTERPVHVFSASRTTPLRWRALEASERLMMKVCPRPLRDALVATGLVVPKRRNEEVARAEARRGRVVWLDPDAAPVKRTGLAESSPESHEELVDRVQSLGWTAWFLRRDDPS